MVAPVAALAAADTVSDVAGALSPAARKKIKAVAQQFEGVFLTNMFEEMFSGLEEEGPMGSGQGQDVWRSMLTEEYANTVARAGGVGVADHIQRELIALQERSR